MSAPAVDPHAVSVKDAARIAAVSTRQIYDWLNAGIVDGRYVGRRRIVLYRSLIEHLDGLPEDPA